MSTRQYSIYSLLIERSHRLRSIFAASTAPVSITVVIDFLRLGRKYDFEGLRVEALHRVFYEIPTTLEDFDKLERGSRIQGAAITNILARNTEPGKGTGFTARLPFCALHVLHLHEWQGSIESIRLLTAVRESKGTMSPKLASRRLTRSDIYHTIPVS